MQALAWVGFAVSIAVLIFTGSSVIKTMLIPRNLSSAAYARLMTCANT